MERIVVVGASLAGLRAAERVRAEGFDGTLTIVGDEPHRPYDRPPLSKGLLTGAAGLDEVQLRVGDDLEADWHLGVRATGLDLDRRVLVTDADELPFDGLVIATGVRPRTLPGFVADGERVFTLRTLDDAQALAAALAARPRVLVVGAGFIGVEVATSARELGCEVDVLSLDPPVAVAGREVSRICTEMLLERGVRLHVGERATKVEAGVVELESGTRVEYDVALVAVGAQPNVEWLEGSGVPVDDGVVCDETCAVVGVPGVVAAGDVASWPNPTFGGLRMRVEHWTNAVEQGHAAGRTLVHGPGPHTEHRSVPGFWSDHCGVRLQSVGLPQLADRLELVAGSLEQREFAAAAYRGDELVGALAYDMPRMLAKYRIALGRRPDGVAA